MNKKKLADSYMVYMLFYTFITIVIVMVSSFFPQINIQRQNYKDCFIERGALINHEVYRGNLHIDFINKASHNRSLFFYDDDGSTIDFTNDNISVKWCYIEEIEDYRVRGVWTW